MSSPDILLTGGSGHVGFATLRLALQEGYSVRAAVRSQAKADLILAAPSIKALAPRHRLTFIVVPDILAIGAYDKALKGIKYVVHIASRIPDVSGTSPAKDFEADLVLPAVEGTLNILTTALKFSVIKKVVITSSILAQVSLETVLGPGDATMYNQDSITPDVYGPFDFEGAAYCASKSRALNATAEFIRKEKPTFDVINILPAYVLGRNELAQDVPSFLSGTNLIAMALVLGKSTEDAMVSAVVTLQDVAKAHIFTLKPNVKGNRNFAATTSVTWNDALEVVKRRFPEAVEDGRLPANGAIPTKKFNYDASETERALGFKFANYEEQVVDVVGQYLEVLAAA